jgi:uncharacterized repeat protein (TIGR03803 family)
MNRLTVLLTSALALAGATLIVKAQVSDNVVRPWTCLTNSLAVGPVFPRVLTTARCPVPASTEWPPLARFARAATAINPPVAPTGLAASVTGQTVVLTWTPPSSGGAPTSYMLQAGSASGLANIANANTGSALPILTATGVPGGTHFFRVLAQNASGTSASSNEITVRVAADCATTPGAPAALGGTVIGSDVTLNWQAPAGGCASTSYVVQAGSSPGLSNLANFSTGSAATSFAASGVPAGLYYVRVLAVNAGGTSGPSNEAPVAVNSCSGAPGPTTGLTFSVFGATVSLAWIAASGSPTGYFIQAGSSPGTSNLGVFGTGGGSFIAQGVPSGTYYVRVFARSSCGTGPVSNEVVLTVGGSGGPSGVTVTPLHGFSGSPSDGSNLATIIQGRDGNFYGTTVTGGPFNSRCSTNLDGCGTAFRMTPGGAVTILYAFGSGGSNPITPTSTLLQAADGNFYGTTAEGAASVYRMTPGGSVTFLTELGGPAEGTLIQTTDGNFYGTTRENGPGTCSWRSTQCTPTPGSGTIYRMSPSGALTYLHVFNGSDGSKPYAGLVRATDGNFYGTTTEGGAYGFGTIYRMTPGGALTTLHNFAGGADGAHPLFSALLQASDGSFYGTTQFGGGPANGGTIFRITPGGAYTVMHSFTGQYIPDGTPPTGAASDGVQPSAGLVQASDGNLYGVTGGGGALGGGTAFMMSPSGVYTQLFMFAGNAEGSSPTATLIQATDGNLYGTAQYGGTYNKGATFRMTMAR